MTMREQVLQNALSLPPEDRAFVAAALEESLETDSADDVPDAVEGTSASAISGKRLLAELQRRSATYRTGTTTARPATDVLTDQRRKQAGEAAQ